jgi:AhpD family alkylhydroperoxidase
MTQRMDYNAATPAGMKALGGVYGHILQSGLPKVLVDLVYLRVSQINGCAYCIDMHSRDLLKEGVTVDKLVLVPAWREAGALFSAAERAAGGPLPPPPPPPPRWPGRKPSRASRIRAYPMPSSKRRPPYSTRSSWPT